MVKTAFEIITSFHLPSETCDHARFPDSLDQISRRLRGKVGKKGPLKYHFFNERGEEKQTNARYELQALIISTFKAT